MAPPAGQTWTSTRRGLLASTAGALLLAGCGRTDPVQQPGRPDRGGPEFLIGASLELTGRGAAVGVLQERALQVTLAALNVEGVPVGNQRRRIRVVVKDNASDPSAAARQASDLVRREQVHALVGGSLTETSMALVGIAQKLQVPFLSLAFGDDIALPVAQRAFVYKLTPDAGDMARRLAHLISSQQLSRVAVLAAAGPHGDSGVQALTGALRAVSVDLVRSVRLPGPGGNIVPAAERAVTGQPDGLVIWATAPDSGAAARSVRRAGYTGPLFFDAGAVAEDTLDGPNAAAVEGAYAVHPASLGDSSLTNTTTAALDRRDFVFRYIQQYGSFSGFAPYASDALRMLATAARLASSVDRGRLRAYLQTLATEGIAGSYAFAPIRHGGMTADSLGLFTVNHGAWTRIA